MVVRRRESVSALSATSLIEQDTSPFKAGKSRFTGSWSCVELRGLVPVGPLPTPFNWSNGHATSPSLEANLAVELNFQPLPACTTPRLRREGRNRPKSGQAVRGSKGGDSRVSFGWRACVSCCCGCTILGDRRMADETCKAHRVHWQLIGCSRLPQQSMLASRIQDSAFRRRVPFCRLSLF